ncbi:hypothetical protein H4582DRAFT_1915260, partial [Lactarius indigo]
MTRIKKTSLKNASFKKKLAAAQACIQKAKGVATNAKPLQRSRSTIPFKSSDKILLIGEGDFSFRQHIVSTNITATAYDTEDECYIKYSEAQQYVRVLRANGAQEKTSALKGKTFDRIVWNFPHAGEGITDQDRNILSNQVLILGFLRSAAKFLVSGPTPQLQPSRKRKRTSNDDDDDGEDSDQTTSTAGRARGTILIH